MRHQLGQTLALPLGGRAGGHGEAGTSETPEIQPGMKTWWKEKPPHTPAPQGFVGELLHKVTSKTFPKNSFPAAPLLLRLKTHGPASSSWSGFLSLHGEAEFVGRERQLDIS